MLAGGAYDKRVVVQCVMMGTQMDRGVVCANGFSAAFRYLQPLTVQQSTAALTQYLVDKEIYSQPQMEALLQQPFMSNQLALVAGLPQLLEFLRNSLEANTTLRNALSQHTLSRHEHDALMQ